MKNNKGFSLVELIIVIAIMAILVGVMAPQLIKYIEKTNVSADTQLCDTVKSAITTAMMDPTVLATKPDSVPNGNNWSNVKSITVGKDDFGASVKEILGFDPSTINSHIKSTHESNSEVQFNIVSNNAVHVRITKTDSTGKKSTGAGNDIYVD